MLHNKIAVPRRRETIALARGTTRPARGIFVIALTINRAATIDAPAAVISNASGDKMYKLLSQRTPTTASDHALPCDVDRFVARIVRRSLCAAEEFK